MIAKKYDLLEVLLVEGPLGLLHFVLCALHTAACTPAHCMGVQCAFDGVKMWDTDGQTRRFSEYEVTGMGKHIKPCT